MTQVKLPVNCSKGVYFIKIIDANYNSSIHKILIQ